jgi:hypothetical protein
MFTSLISLSSGENRRRLSSALETKEKRDGSVGSEMHDGEEAEAEASREGGALESTLITSLYTCFQSYSVGYGTRCISPRVA